MSAIIPLADKQILLPIQIKRRSGCKKVVLSNGETAKPKAWDTKGTSLQLALARGYRWLAMLESDEVKSFREIAEREHR